MTISPFFYFNGVNVAKHCSPQCLFNDPCILLLGTNLTLEPRQSKISPWLAKRSPELPSTGMWRGEVFAISDSPGGGGGALTYMSSTGICAAVKTPLF